MKRFQVRQVYEDGEVSKIGPLGFVNKYPKGWLFISHVASHSNGRVYRDTPEAAVPKWIKRFKLILVA